MQDWRVWHGATGVKIETIRYYDEKTLGCPCRSVRMGNSVLCRCSSGAVALHSASARSLDMSWRRSAS